MTVGKYFDCHNGLFFLCKLLLCLIFKANNGMAHRLIRVSSNILLFSKIKFFKNEYV